MRAWEKRGCRSDRHLPARLDREIRSPVRNANRNRVKDEVCTDVMRVGIDRRLASNLDGVAQRTESAPQRTRRLLGMSDFGRFC
jgi:hypothetical protein